MSVRAPLCLPSTGPESYPSLDPVQYSHGVTEFSVLVHWRSNTSLATTPCNEEEPFGGGYMKVSLTLIFIEVQITLALFCQETLLRYCRKTGTKKHTDVCKRQGNGAYLKGLQIFFI